MRDTTDGKVIINSDDCFGQLGTLTHLKDGEKFTLRQ